MFRQLVYRIAQGYETLNDHKQLRKDKLIHIAVRYDKTLASHPSLCKFKNCITRKTLVQISKILVENFIESYRKAPKELILDFDGTMIKFMVNKYEVFYTDIIIINVFTIIFILW